MSFQRSLCALFLSVATSTANADHLQNGLYIHISDDTLESTPAPSALAQLLYYDITTPQKYALSIPPKSQPQYMPLTPPSSPFQAEFSQHFLGDTLHIDGGAEYARLENYGKRAGYNFDLAFAHASVAVHISEHFGLHAGGMTTILHPSTSNETARLTTLEAGIILTTFNSDKWGHLKFTISMEKEYEHSGGGRKASPEVSQEAGLEEGQEEGWKEGMFASARYNLSF